MTSSPALIAAEVQTDCLVCHHPIARGHGAHNAPHGLLHARPHVCIQNMENDAHAAKYANQTSAEFMAILEEIQFNQFMAKIPIILCLPEPKPKPQPKPRIDIAGIEAWLATRIETVDLMELGQHPDYKQITPAKANELNIQDTITAYRRLGGKLSYGQILDGMMIKFAHPTTDKEKADEKFKPAVRILAQNTPTMQLKMQKYVSSLKNKQLKIAIKENEE